MRNYNIGEFMRVLSLIFIILLNSSCDTNGDIKKSDDIYFFYQTTTKDFYKYNSDTVKIDKIQQPDIKDTFLLQSMFELNGETHWINLFTNYLKCPIDGGYIAYTLDTMGIIYMRSTTWKSYSRLKCTNDSIDNIINIALENIILNQEFHDIDLSKLYDNHHRAFINPLFN